MSKSIRVAVLILIISGCATNGGVAILSPGGQTIAGPGKYEALSNETITLASFFFRSRGRIAHLCATVINTGEITLKLKLEESPGTGLLVESDVLPAHDASICARDVGAVTILCPPTDEGGKSCSAIWRVDQVRTQ